MWQRLIGMIIAAAVLCLALPAEGQSCNPTEPCMINGMCMPNGTCLGTPVSGGSCEVPQADANCVLATGTCVNGICKGTSAPAGTRCGAGCGTCQLPFPSSNSTICTTTAGQGGQPCDLGLGPCFPGTCSTGQFAVCLVTYKTCPDIDHNPCTADICNPSTGECEHLDVPPCDPVCETCNPTTGQCEPANQGVACAGPTECTAQGHCGAVDAGTGMRGVCLAGAATAPSPTPSATVELGGTPTPTVTPPSGSCAGDCNGDGQVTVDELLTLVNVALGNADVSTCSNGDANHDMQITIDEILAAVNNALSGCPVIGAAITCSAGYHRACHGGSGRGGGYRTTCSCVINPPPVCVTAWGAPIQAGTTVILYDTNTVYAPDTCTAHGTPVSCDVNGFLHPPNATGYPVCTVLGTEN